MDQNERTARIAQNLLYGILFETRGLARCEAEAKSEAADGIERLTPISAIRSVASRMATDTTADGLLDELLAVAARDLTASGRAGGAALLREAYCLDDI